jgi:hypothetical protein
LGGVTINAGTAKTLSDANGNYKITMPGIGHSAHQAGKKEQR